MAHLLDLGNGNLQNTTARAARNARVGGGVNISDGVYGTILDLVILPNKQSIYNRTSSSWLVVSRICLRYLEKVKHILPNGGLYLPRYKVKNHLELIQVLEKILDVYPTQQSLSKW